MAEPFLAVRNLSKHYAPGAFSRGPVVKALQDVSFDVGRGEVVGLVGESGSGKTTIGRSVLRLIEPTSGEIRFDGVDIAKLGPAELRRQRLKMQYIFQDPFASLSPRMTIGEILTEGLDIQAIGTKAERREKAERRSPRSSCRPMPIHRYAHEFSGGQRQRIGIARALTLEPSFIVADEPVSALDVSIQAIINLLRDLQVRLGLTMLFISHDLAVVEYICDTVIVLYLGRIMEIAPAASLYARPQHPYARPALRDPVARSGRPLEAPDPQGRDPEPGEPASGCVFRTRCPHAIEACAGKRQPCARRPSATARPASGTISDVAHRRGPAGPPSAPSPGNTGEIMLDSFQSRIVWRTLLGGTWCRNSWCFARARAGTSTVRWRERGWSRGGVGSHSTRIRSWMAARRLARRKE